MIEYRVGRKQLSPPGTDGRFDRARALAELAAKPKQKGGRKRGMKITPKTAETGARESAPVLRDPATRFRLARAGQEEIKLAKMRGTVERVATVAPRTFHLIRGDRDRLLAWVSRTAPLIAAEIRVDEGTLWRAIQRAVSALLSDVAALAVDTDDEDEEAPTPGVREDSTPVPRDAETRFQLARA